MLFDTILQLKTNPSLLKRIEDLSDKKLTSSEVFEQRVSFVYGLMGGDNNVTKSEVRKAIQDYAGVTEAVPA